MAQALGHPTTDKAEAVDAVLRSIRQLSARVGIPKNLRELVGGRATGRQLSLLL